MIQSSRFAPTSANHIVGLYLCIFFAASLHFVSCARAQDNVRQPAVAGRFYPADAQQLKSEVEQYVREASTAEIDGEILGLVAPHAGYAYSGRIAASAYKQVDGEDYDVIVAIAPSHRDPFRGATIYPGTAYKTPLGDIPIHRSLAQQIVEACEHIHFSEYGHRAEHALEVQLPFVQTLFPEADIIPIVMGFVDWPGCEKIGHALAELLDNKNALIIASTDLYHGESYDDCVKTNERTLEAMVNLQPKKLFDGFSSESLQACGGSPVVVMQIAAKALGADAATLISRTNSNDVIGQKGGYVVGYGAIAVYQKNSQKASSGKIESAPRDRQNQIAMIKIARTATEPYLENQTIPEFQATNDFQLERRGVFVTITKNGYLRGCIGHHESNVPLCRLVPRLAVAAAFGDPRFPPLRVAELDEITIKISVYLTNVYQIASLDEFEMGVHGIILRKDGRAATYLPEVPLEAGWTTIDEEMVSLCQKAGLPSNAWKNGAEFWVYRTQAFDETVLMQ